MDFTGENDLERALKLLAGHLRLAKTPPVNLVVCGGAALLARRLHLRTTQDVDVLALLDSEAHLHSPLPLPGYLLEAARDVADTLGLPGDWLNNAPSADAAGLYQSGLPEGSCSAPCAGTTATGSRSGMWAGLTRYISSCWPR